MIKGISCYVYEIESNSDCPLLQLVKIQFFNLIVNYSLHSLA